MSYKAFLLLAIVLSPKPAIAQPINNMIRQWTSPTPSYPGDQWQNLPSQQPISREQLRWINELSGGQDQWGNLNQPVPSSQIVPGNYPDGVYRFPMDWDPDRSLILNVQDGNIRRQDYVIPR